jgi:hypothetical protein
MRRGGPALWVALIAGIVHADERPKARYHLGEEIAWARARWPNDLKGLHFHVPLAKLLSWAPPKETTLAYLYTQDFPCRRVELVRDEPDESDAEERPRELTGTISDPPRVLNGRQIRDVTYFGVGRTLSRENGVTNFETRTANGSWEPGGGGGIWLDPIVYGALSSVDDRVARFGGDAQYIHAFCNGPTVWLRCPGGGHHPCNRCDRVALWVMDAETDFMGGGSGDGGRPIACDDRCPIYPDSPDLARVRELNARSSIWRPHEGPPSEIPSLYKSRNDCLREHPPKSDAAAEDRD